MEDGTRALVQGQDSKYLKFEEVLCQACNTTLTQPFDRAYDAFIEHVSANTDTILALRRIDLRDVFGTCGRKRRRNLFNYFLKSFGCRLASCGVTVPPEIQRAIHGDPVPTTLVLTFSVYEPLANISTALEKIAVVHRLEGTKDALTGEYDDLNWGISYGWFTVAFWYRKRHNPTMGDPWNGQSRHIVLGSLNDAAI